LLGADANRVDLESRLIKLLPEDRARVSVCWQRPLMAQGGRSPVNGRLGLAQYSETAFFNSILAPGRLDAVIHFRGFAHTSIPAR
jgi:hypothetical protein